MDVDKRNEELDETNNPDLQMESRRNIQISEQNPLEMKKFRK